MNKDLLYYETDDCSASAILDYEFSLTKLDRVQKHEVLEILSSTVFLDTDIIKKRLDCENDDAFETDFCSLFYILESFDIDYIKLTRNRLHKIGVTKIKLINLIRDAIGVEGNGDTLSIIEKIFDDDDFNNLWKRVEYIVGEFSYLLKILGVELNSFLEKDEFETVLNPFDEDEKKVFKFDEFIK